MKRTKKKGNVAFNIVSIVIVLLILTAIFAPYIAPNDPNITNIMVAQAPPVNNILSGQIPWAGVCFPE